MHVDVTAAPDLAEFWHRLADVGDPQQLPDYDLTAIGLVDALALIEAGRAVPSAGAIFPHECYVICWQADGLAVFRADAAAKRCQRLAAQRSPELALAAAGLPAPRPGGAHVIVVTRPWLSMRKYGHRGYLYTQLDSAHLAVNLLGLALDRDPGAVLRLRVDRKGLADLLDLGQGLREIHSVLSFGPSARTPAVSGWTGVDARGRESSSEFHNPLESACRRMIGPPLVSTAELPPVPPRPVSFTVRARTAPNPLAEPGSWTRLAGIRCSSKHFWPGALVRPEQLAATLATTTLPLPVDLPTDGVRLTVVHADQVRQHVFLRACMFQRHLVDAQAYVLLHVATRDLVGHQRPQLMREMIFRAGAVGHLLYLGAAHAGLGITAVGGFDGRRWAGLGGLPGDHEVLYVLALGHDRDGGAKLDRMQPAYAQAER